MDEEIARLEGQLEQLIGLYQAGREQSRELRQRVALLEAENRRLAGKLQLATDRLESVLEKLPEL